MKYLRLYESFEINKQDIRNLFLDLEDDGFTINIHDKSETDRKDDFYYVVINKLGVPYNLYETNLIDFRINDVVEILLFAESYARDEMKLKISYVYTDLGYCNSVSELPLGGTTETLHIYFEEIK